MQNREAFERMLDEIMAEYPDAEQEIAALKDKMGGAEADLMADEEGAEMPMDGEEEDLEAMPVMKKKPKPMVEEDEEEEII